MVIDRLRGPLAGVQGALLIPFNPPTVSGTSSIGGFQFEVQDPSGNSLQALADATNRLSAEGNQSGRLAGLFTSFTANDPQYLVKMTARRRRACAFRSIKLPTHYKFIWVRYNVNDFDFNNRAYRVYVQRKEDSGTRRKISADITYAPTQEK